MRHPGTVSETPVTVFFAYIQRRRTVMAMSGGGGIVVGVLGAVLIGTGPGVAWLVVLAAVGLLLVLAARAGTSLRQDALTLVGGPFQKMDLTTWPYRTIRSPVRNRLLVTLDVPGSIDRTPLAELKPVWYTPGKSAANASARSANVYGSLDKGRTVLAVADDGSCYLGRVSRTRPPRP